MDLAWLPFVTGPLAAVIGATIGFRLSGPRVRVTVDRVVISPSRHASLDPVTPDLALQNRVAKFSEQLVTLTSPSVPERTYVTYLRLLSVQLQKSIEKSSSSLVQADTFRGLALSDEFAVLYEQYRLAQGELWAMVEVYVARGMAVFSRPDPYSDESSRPVEKYAIFEEDEGDYVLDVGEGGLGFMYTQRKNPAGRARSKEFAGRALRAFAFEDRQELAELFTAIRECARNTRQAAVELSEVVHDELIKFDRLQVEYIVSNSGRAAVSVSSSAIAAIDIKGYSYSLHGRSATVAKNQRIMLTALGAEQIPALEEASLNSKISTLPSNNDLAPELVQAGAARRMVAVASERMLDLPEGMPLGLAFGAAERTFRIEVQQFRPRGRQRWIGKRKASITRRLTSARLLFRVSN